MVPSTLQWLGLILKPQKAPFLYRPQHMSVFPPSQCLVSSSSKAETAGCGVPLSGTQQQVLRFLKIFQVNPTKGLPK